MNPGEKRKLVKVILQELGDPVFHHRSIIDKGDWYLCRLMDVLTCIGKGPILEIGTNRGGSALFMSRALQLLGRDNMLYTVDPEQPPKEVFAFIEKHGLRLRFVLGKSPDTTAVLCSKFTMPLSLLFIDGSHNPNDTIVDFQSHRKYFSKRTVVCIDDVRVNSTSWGGWELVSTLAGQEGVSVVYESNPCRSDVELAFCVAVFDSSLDLLQRQTGRH